MPEATQSGNIDSSDQNANNTKTNNDESSLMFASVCTQYGDAKEVFEIRKNIPRPTIAQPDQVLVRTYYTTVNPADCKQRSGNLKLVAKQHDFPFVLGQDFVGRVVEIGSKSKLRPGQVVMGSTAPRNSCSAEYLVCFSNECVCVHLDEPKDETEDDHFTRLTKIEDLEETKALAAAACPTAYCTAWKGLFDIGMLPTPDRYQSKAIDRKTNNANPNLAVAKSISKSILIVGASGSVGSAAVQLAVGVATKIDTVVAICGTNNVEYVQSLRNSDTRVFAVDYKQPIYEKKISEKNNGQPFDLILDCVGGDDYYYKLHPLLNFDNPKAKYVTCVGPVLHGGSEPITYKTLLSTVCTLVPRLMGNYFLFGRRNSRYQIYLGFDTSPLQQIRMALNEGRIVPRIDPESPLPLEELGRAHEMVETGHSSGKVLVKVQLSR